VISLILACTASVNADYEQHRLHALADPAQVYEGWAADGALRLSSELVEEMLRASLSQALNEADDIDVGIGRLEPRLEVEKLALVDGDCEDCIGVSGRLVGEARFLTALGTTTSPLQVDFRGDCIVDAVPVDDPDRPGIFQLELRVVEIQRMQVDLSGGLLSVDLASLLLAELPTVAIGEVGGEALPLSALRVLPDTDGVRIEMLTASAHPGQIAEWGEGPTEGFVVVLHEETLLDRVRHNAFVRGPGRLNLEFEPLMLDFEGEGFTLDLRLWRIQRARSWWRDYRVTGDLLVDDGTLKLVANDAVLVDRSPGAGVADPLSSLARSTILRGIEDAVSTAVPAQKDLSTEALSIQATVTKASGEGPLLVLRGAAEVKQR